MWIPLTIHGCHDDILLQGCIRIVFASLLASPAFVAALSLSFARDTRRMDRVAHLVERLLECSDEILGFESGFIFFLFHC